MSQHLIVFKRQISPKLKSCRWIFACLSSVKWLLERLCTTGRRRATGFQLSGQTQPGRQSMAPRRFPLSGSRSGEITCYSLFQGILFLSLQNTNQYFWSHCDNCISIVVNLVCQEVWQTCWMFANIVWKIKAFRGFHQKMQLFPILSAGGTATTTPSTWQKYQKYQGMEVAVQMWSLFQTGRCKNWATARPSSLCRACR